MSDVVLEDSFLSEVEPVQTETFTPQGEDPTTEARTAELSEDAPDLDKPAAFFTQPVEPKCEGGSGCCCDGCGPCEECVERAENGPMECGCPEPKNLPRFTSSHSDGTLGSCYDDPYLQQPEPASESTFPWAPEDFQAELDAARELF